MHIRVWVANGLGCEGGSGSCVKWHCSIKGVSSKLLFPCQAVSSACLACDEELAAFGAQSVPAFLRFWRALACEQMVHAQTHPPTHARMHTHTRLPRSILIRLLRRNSMAALELHQRTPSKAPAELGRPAEPPVEDGTGGDKEGADRDGLGLHDKDVVATRTGVHCAGWCHGPAWVLVGPTFTQALL